MATAGSIVQSVRIQYGDPDRDFITDTIGFEWLTKAQRRLCHEVLALDEIKDYPVVEGQKRYDLPDNCYIPFTALWWKDSRRELQPLDPSQWDQYEVRRILTTGYPTGFTVIRRQLVVGPAAPLSNSATALASGDYSSSATTIGLTSASGLFRSRGWLVNSTTGEVVEYTAIASTTVTGCSRGVHGTSTASVASNQQWKEVDLQMRYRRAPTDITASTQTPDVPTIFQDYLEHYMLYLAWRARGDKAKADAAYSQFEMEEKRAKDTVGRRIFSPRAIKDRRHMRGYEWGAYGDGM